MDPFAAAREAMVAKQIVARGIDDPALLAAFRSVPRHLFVPSDLQHRAYDDGPLPIGCGQTISQPFIVALTLAAAGIGPNDTILEVGAGSGYAAALIGQVANKVMAIELLPELAALARERMARLGYDNVHIIEGDGTLGLPGEPPFDAIVAAACGSHVPPALIDQLKPAGVLVMPVGSQLWSQTLKRIEKRDDGIVSEDLCAVRFVPLVNAQLPG